MCRPAGGGDAYQPLQQEAEGLDAVCAEVLNMVPAKPRAVGPSFLFAADHCFPIKGQGTVFTGTVLQVCAACCAERSTHAACPQRDMMHS